MAIVQTFRLSISFNQTAHSRSWNCIKGVFSLVVPAASNVTANYAGSTIDNWLGRGVI